MKRISVEFECGYMAPDVQVVTLKTEAPILGGSSTTNPIDDDDPIN